LVFSVSQLRVKRDLSVERFFQKYAFPYGISPAGPAGLFRPAADVLSAQAAKAASSIIAAANKSLFAIEYGGPDGLR
jgi:L-lactate dehydrogenase (cytochrome)/(S)-mandelate dehydrogenase